MAASTRAAGAPLEAFPAGGAGARAADRGSTGGGPTRRGVMPSPPRSRSHVHAACSASSRPAPRAGPPACPPATADRKPDPGAAVHARPDHDDGPCGADEIVDGVESCSRRIPGQASASTNFLCRRAGAPSVRGPARPSSSNLTLGSAARRGQGAHGRAIFSDGSAARAATRRKGDGPSVPDLRPMWAGHPSNASASIDDGPHREGPVLLPDGATGPGVQEHTC